MAHRTLEPKGDAGITDDPLGNVILYGKVPVDRQTDFLVDCPRLNNVSLLPFDEAWEVETAKTTDWVDYSVAGV